MFPNWLPFHFYKGATALHLAIAYGNDEIAQEIVAVSNEKATAMLVSTVARGKSYHFNWI